MFEEWRLITIAPSYEISNLGRVRNRRTGHLKKTHLDKAGDLCVNLRREKFFGNRSYKAGGGCRVRILVMHAFSKEIPGERGKVVRLKDGNKSNCRFHNLYYSTRQEVSRENWRLGKMAQALLKTAFVKGNVPKNPFLSGSRHPRWNPKSPLHLKHLRICLTKT